MAQTQPNPPPLPKNSARSPEQLVATLFAALMGGWLGVALLKFGNPIILDKMIERPHGIWELIFSTP